MRSRARRRLAAAALLAAFGSAACATREAAAVRRAVESLVRCEDLAGGRIGAIVVDAGTGEVLAAHEADRGFATASNMKLVSGAVALSALGPDFTTTTELWQRGEVRDGVLHGDLVLRGHGDPTFADARWPGAPFLAFAAALRQQGITKVRGRVVGDGSWQGPETLGLGWQWDYLDEDYAAPFGGLVCMGNVTTLRVRPHPSGTPTVEATPGVAPPDVRIEQVPAGAATKLVARRPLGSAVCELRGQIAADAKEQVLRVPTADPAAAAAAVLVAELRSSGIEVEGAVVASAEAGPTERLVASHASPPLAAILGPMLTASDNLCAEQLWRVAARVATGDGGTVSAAAHAKRVLAELGIDTAGMVLADGSGLSRRNLVQPRQLAGVLAAMHRSPHREAFVAGLPLAGATGTLRSRFVDGPARGRVRAKTGFLARVVCLSGYVPRPEPERAPLVFSAMLNDFTCDEALAKAAVDAFVQQVAAAAGW